MVLAVLPVAAVAAVVMSRLHTDSTPAFETGPLFPDLAGRVDDIAQVEARKGSETFTVTKVEDGWVVPARSNYPADPGAIRELILGASHLSRLEPKTSRPEYYDRLGLDDDSNPLRLNFVDRNGTVLATLLVGNQKTAGSNRTTDQYFVRVGDDPKSWLVEGHLPALADASDWLNTQVLAVDRQRVRSVQVVHPDGETVTAQRAQPDQTDFGIDGLAAGETVTSAYAVNGMASVFSDLELADVAVAAERELPDEQVVRVVMTTFDGLRVRVAMLPQEDSVLARFESEYDPALVVESETAGLKSGPEVEEEAGTLRNRWTGWVYTLPEWRMSGLLKRRDELLDKPEPATPEPADGRNE